ncbi:NUDIX domain-containing protein [Pseudonocardia sp. N23]|uniref:NUDIX hydrolase n=1 Tax=Pseudonocardia sp. N23 TaxID=1987376 RepID=UPI000BFB40C7|nr:NUDIX domain-containing protein [Pseudonocardia sp. N23]GAY10893.1 hypothetical protein TOK_5377 [Pseudonocardia sp. N23]
MSAGATSTREPVVPRPAATVLLLRDDPDGRLQVFLQRRVKGMAFAGGMTVFPGGGVDASDRADGVAWEGPEPGWWADRLRCTTDEAAGFVLAAVRETFEECGVLLADGAAVDAATLAEARDDVAQRRRPFGDVLAGLGLRIRADQLRAWARWITPIVQPRRYDTAFFTAIVPPGQEADAQTTEAVEAAWWTPAAALEAFRDGEIGLMRPTRTILTDISAFPDSAALHAAAPGDAIVSILPMVVEGLSDVLLPGDDGYDLDVASGRAHADGHAPAGGHR